VVAFTTTGYGQDLPLVAGASAAAWAANDRIEIIVEDDPGDPIFRVTVAADRLDVILDCDDFTSTPSAAAGDFYVQVEFYSDDDRGLVRAVRSPNTLVQLNAGEGRDLEIVAEERFLMSDDAVLNGVVYWYENDTSGVHQFDFSEEINLLYDRRGDRWVDLDVGGDCIPSRNVEIAAGTLSANQPPSASVDGCIADLDWSLQVDRVAR